MSPTSGIISSSHHQFGVSTTHPLHSTHFSYTYIWGSTGKWSPASSSYLPAGPWKNCSTLGPSIGGGPRSNSASSSSHCGGLCDGELVGLLSGKAWQHIWLHPQDLLLCQSQLWDGVWASGWPLVRDWLSHSIFSSRMMVVTRALWWASITSASWVSAEVPPLSPHGVLFHVG